MLSPTVTRRLVHEFVSQSPRSLEPHPYLHTLTEREREVVGLVVGTDADVVEPRKAGLPRAMCAYAETSASGQRIRVNGTDGYVEILPAT